MRAIAIITLAFSASTYAGAFPLFAQPRGSLSSGKAEPEPLIGKWFGTAGPETDRIPFGLDIRLDDKGQIKAYIYENAYYGEEAPGSFKRDGNSYSLSGMTLDLTRRGDSLDGVFTSLKLPFTLRRVRQLPSERPLPTVHSPKPVWRSPLGAPIYAPVVVRDGYAYVGSTGGAFFSLSLDSGKMNWMFVAGRPIHGEATVTDSAVFVAADNGFLFKLERTSGKEIWRYDLGDARTDRVLGHPETDDFDWDMEAPKPVLHDGVLYIGSSDGSFHAVSASSGERVWRFPGSAKIRATALVGDSTIVFGNWAGDLYALERRSGRQLWMKALRASVTSTPTLVDNRLVVGLRGGVLYGIDPANGAILWRAAFWGSAVESDPAPLGNQFFIGSSDLRRVLYMDAADGRVRWRTDVYGMPWAGPLLADSVLYVSVTGSKVGRIRHVGSLTALDARSGKTLWAWRMPDAPGSLFTGFTARPALAGSRIIVGGIDGSVYAFPSRPVF